MAWTAISKVAHADPKSGDTRTIGGIAFVYIPVGNFMMGSRESPEELERRYGVRISWLQGEKPVHRVTLDGFWMGRYEVTQGQYEAVMGKNPSHFNGDGRRPVEQVGRNEAAAFCRRFGERNHVEIRLPTEAECEYAARAGSTTIYYWGDRIDGDSLWYDGNSNGTTHRVGEKRPNAWGLYDMSGNVWEWCSDWYDEKYFTRSPERNPKGPESGQSRVVRGGSWGNNVFFNRSAYRYWYIPDNRSYVIGFRVVVVSSVGK